MVYTSLTFGVRFNIGCDMPGFYFGSATTIDREPNF